MTLKPTKIKCPKCKNKTEEIYYNFGVIRNKCIKCGFIFLIQEKHEKRKSVL